MLLNLIVNLNNNEKYEMAATINKCCSRWHYKSLCNLNRIDRIVRRGLRLECILCRKYIRRQYNDC